MVTALPPNFRNTALVRNARALFTDGVVKMLSGLQASIGQTLATMAEQPGNARVQQEVRDALQAYQKNSAGWVRRTQATWTQPMSEMTAASPLSPSAIGGLELVDDASVEHRILASRLALRLLDFSSWELNDLRLRIQSLQNTPDLHKLDIFRPEVLAQGLIEQWGLAGLPAAAWLLVQEMVQKSMAAQILDIYHATNEFLIREGVMPEIDLRQLVRRTPSAVGVNTTRPSAVGPVGAGGAGGANDRQPGQTGKAGDAAADRPGSGATAAGGGAGGAGHSPQAGKAASSAGRQEPAGPSPLARARARAQNVVGHLKQLLVKHVVGFDDSRPAQASPQLAQAMSRMQETEAANSGGRSMHSYDMGETQYQLDQALLMLRQRTGSLKQSATTSSEKATIEIVALMFQSILSEDRIPPNIRVWFARLQMPVLRVAIAEPEFFSALEHPARQLIDRMGSCVLGFDVTVAGGVMEVEIRRVVQVIEQYPETGRRVFLLVYDEFDKFLSRFLAEQGTVGRVAGLAQQLEQKETMAIQYTIEMRTMLNDMPVRDEIREFLFKVWAEVLAIAAVKNGPQHAHTLELKQSAADLVWSASAKANRADRTRVIAGLPKQLQLLRQGMTLLGLDEPAQEVHLKTISDILADAFLSKTDVIPFEKVEAMSRRLSNLEDYLSDEDVGDLPMDTDSLVTMIGLDAAHMEVIGNGGNEPTEAMRTWARELQPGSWFNLDHNGKSSHVQFAWCSDRKQLHLFASADGHSYLIQMRRLAAYLQAGLLVPTEDESLTVRATREALAKLDANPERLLS